MSKPTSSDPGEPDGPSRPLDLLSTYAHLTDDGAARSIPIGETFWPEVMRGEHPELNQGRLVSRFEFERNWSSWERHPYGDELVILLCGKVEMLLERDDGRVTRLRLVAPGQFVSIPRGTWHTAHPDGTCSMLFVTPGRDTEHKPA